MIYTFGESLMDIIQTKDGLTEAKPGGSMLNVAVSLGRAGKEVSLISEMGDDQTGRALTDFLAKNRVSTHLIRKYPGFRTSVAKVTLDEEKKPAYEFIKAYPEKRSLPHPPIFTPQDIFILGSMYSRDLKIKEDINAYLKSAKRGGALIVYDPNIRQSHAFDDRDMLFNNLANADVIKGSNEDFLNIFGTNDPEMVKKELQKINPVALLIITLGEKGSVSYFGKMIEKVPAIHTDVVSTVGAGDAYTAGVVSAITELGISRGLTQLTKENLKKILYEGTLFSSRVCGSMENYIPAL